MPRVGGMAGTIGAMDQWLMLQQNVAATDVLGGQGPDNWTDVDEVWAEITPLSGSERVQAQMTATQLLYRARIYYRADVRAAWRGRWEGRILQFQAVVLEDGRKDFLVIDCAESA